MKIVIVPSGFKECLGAEEVASAMERGVTRAVVFIPSLLLFSETIGIDPTTVVFLSLIGMNYCVTVPFSSKALLLFYEEGAISYDAKKLIKISALLMPLFIVVMMLFYFTYWQWVGMQLYSE